jgi:hypothetical protein
MKIKIFSLIYFIVCMLFIIFTKNSEILFLGENQYCYNYGFPFRTFITDFNNKILHIYTMNIIYNFIASVPLISLLLLCKLTQKFKKINNVLLFMFSLYSLITFFLPWSYKKYIYSFALLMYGLLFVWFIFLFFYFILQLKKEIK